MTTAKDTMRTIMELAWTAGVCDTLNAVESIEPMLGKGTGYSGPIPDELRAWCAVHRDHLAVMELRMADPATLVERITRGGE